MNNRHECLSPQHVTELVYYVGAWRDIVSVSCALWRFATIANFCLYLPPMQSLLKIDRRSRIKVYKQKFLWRSILVLFSFQNMSTLHPLLHLVRFSFLTVHTFEPLVSCKGKPKQLKQTRAQIKHICCPGILYFKVQGTKYNLYVAQEFYVCAYMCKLSVAFQSLISNYCFQNGAPQKVCSTKCTLKQAEKQFGSPHSNTI